MTGLIRAAAVAALLTASGAHASITRFDTPIDVPGTTDGIYINFLTGQTTTSEFAGWDFNPFQIGGGLSFYWGGDQGSVSGGVSVAPFDFAYKDLAEGTVISSASSFSQASSSSFYLVNFLNSGTHTLGFKFLNEATSAVDYGYLSITTTAPDGFPAKILGWSFENTGAAITVANTPTAVPEAATWTMMILGFGAVGSALRHRQKVAMRLSCST